MEASSVVVEENRAVKEKKVQKKNFNSALRKLGRAHPTALLFEQEVLSSSYSGSVISASGAISFVSFVPHGKQHNEQQKNENHGLFESVTIALAMFVRACEKSYKDFSLLNLLDEDFLNIYWNVYYSMNGEYPVIDEKNAIQIVAAMNALLPWCVASCDSSGSAKVGKIPQGFAAVIDPLFAPRRLVTLDVLRVIRKEEEAARKLEEKKKQIPKSV